MRTDTQHLIKGTPGSIALCERMTKRTNGTIIFGFSRGKDAVCAWLWLRRFFHTIIPFHIATIPHLSFVDRSLAYYEDVFQTKIIRFVSGDSRWLMHNLLFQPGGDEKRILEVNRAVYRPTDTKRYDNNDLTNVVRGMYETEHGKTMPDGGWVAFGISAYDSLFRRLRMTEKGGGLKKDAGIRESTKVFFPCYDWHTTDVVRAIELSGIRLPDDYTMSNRTVATIDCGNLARMKRTHYKDFLRVRSFFPFIEAHIARNEFRKMRQKGVSGVKDYKRGQAS